MTLLKTAIRNETTTQVSLQGKLHAQRPSLQWTSVLQISLLLLPLLETLNSAQMVTSILITAQN